MTLTPMRRAVAAAMTASAAVPQFTLEACVDARAARTPTAGGSVEDVVVAAAAHTLRDHPRLNASFTTSPRDAITEHADVNVGVAVAVDDGIVAPAIRHADRLTVGEIRAERRRLTAAAREGTLRPAELYSATFTVSNLGGHGISRFRALVIPPQAAILAVGALDAEQRMWVSLSVDHRVTDGVPAARFLTDLVHRIETGFV
ncbi:2-oxo acid dehydrogenase subunit E2 [Mycobacterium manitobense]|uniref:2-oxo acid dehydrogenase subunit E2 n=1 Tax=[Mycobacterium] manitobense TaxID=190147 RepID=A0A9X2YLG2_9MYCO|nr:2-oxo acid dehydrogenase subunit E2 [[Mycobacterium] manitobense]MCV7169585.1 2-oxo acid dehydrogenase subunit E2 [[Mycobacterium] manitobense]